MSTEKAASAMPTEKIASAMSTEEIATWRARIEQFVRMRNATALRLQKMTRQYKDERKYSVYRQARPETIAQLDKIEARLQECDSVLDAAIIEFSQACARPLGKHMQDLPRELRDMIYENLLHRVERHSFRLALDAPEKHRKMWQYPKLEQSPNTDLAAFSYFKAPPDDDPCEVGLLHYEDPECYGTAFVLELTELYFRRTTFVCDQFESRSSVATFPPLGRFLKQDPFNTGYNVHQRIQKLELNLVEKAWDYGPDAVDRRLLGQFLVEDKENSAAERLREMELEAKVRSKRLSDLSNALSIIKKNCAINIKFRVYKDHDEGLMRWRVMCTALMPIVEMLENNGCTVSFHATVYSIVFKIGDYEITWCEKFWDMKTTKQPFHAYLVDMLKKYPVSDVASETSTIQAFTQQFTKIPDRPRPMQRT